jgi:hypothetical protein
MKFEEVLPALREGKKARRKSWCDGILISSTVIDNLSSASIFADDWEIEPEAKPPKLLAPALYYTGTEWILGRILFESIEDAKEYHTVRDVVWPAIPNKDGFYEVPQ